MFETMRNQYPATIFRKLNDKALGCLNLRWYPAGNWQTGTSDHNGRLARVQHWRNALERIFDGGTTVLGTRIRCPFPARTFPYHVLWAINPYGCISNVRHAEPGLRCQYDRSLSHLRHFCQHLLNVYASGVYSTLSHAPAIKLYPGCSDLIGWGKIFKNNIVPSGWASLWPGRLFVALSSVFCFLATTRHPFVSRNNAI